MFLYLNPNLNRVFFSFPCFFSFCVYNFKKRKKGVSTIAIHLMRGEKVIWKSFPGKNYRMFILGRDLGFGLFVSLFSYMGRDMFYLGLSDKFMLTTSIIIFLLFFCLAIFNQINFLLTQYFLTNQRIIIKKGLLNRNLSSVKLEHIIDTRVEQKLSDRLIRSGTIYIFNSNDRFDDKDHENDKVAAFRNIDNPFLVHRTMEEILEGTYEEDQA